MCWVMFLTEEVRHELATEAISSILLKRAIDFDEAFII